MTNTDTAVRKAIDGSLETSSQTTAVSKEMPSTTGTNTARQLIKKLGAENLKVLPAEKLPELIKMAEEDLADAQ